MSGVRLPAPGPSAELEARQMRFDIELRHHFRLVVSTVANPDQQISDQRDLAIRRLQRKDAQRDGVHRMLYERARLLKKHL